MAGKFRRSVAAAALFSCMVGGGAVAAPFAGAPQVKPPAASPVQKSEEKAPSWVELTPDQRVVLAPLGPEWDRMPAVQRKRLLGVANRYPKMTPEQQRRIRARLDVWSRLTPEQRTQARDKFIKLKQLPPEKRQEIKRKWVERQQAAQPVAPPAATAPVQGGSN